MMRATCFLVVLLITGLSEGEELRSCAGEDVCSAIIYNQLALLEMKQDMGEVVSQVQGFAGDMENITDTLTSKFLEATEDIKKLVMALKSQDSVNNIREELRTCLSQKDDLASQIISLEKKNQEIMSRDEAMDDEKDNLQRENNDLKKATVALQELVTLQKEYIENLTIINYLPVDCADWKVRGEAQSGVYTIYPARTKEESREVLCDMESNGGGWSVFFTRQPQEQPIDFNESWENFKLGFGNLTAEHWLGNDLLHLLLSYGASSLRIDAENFSGNKRWAEWKVFNVGDESNKYQLTLEQYQENSTLGDSISSVNRSFFTTFDRDNDQRGDMNCAVGNELYNIWGKGGWWYNRCGDTRPTAPLKNTNYWDSSCWKYWKNQEHDELVSFKILSMKFRRQNYEELADHKTI